MMYLKSKTTHAVVGFCEGDRQTKALQRPHYVVWKIAQDIARETHLMGGRVERVFRWENRSVVLVLRIV